MKFIKLIAISLLLLIGTSACTPFTETTNNFKQVTSMSTRTFKIGTAGFLPPNFPDHTETDLREFWQDTNDAGEVYGVHTNWTETSIIETAYLNTNNDLEVVLGFQNPKEWKHQVKDYIKTIKTLLSNYPRIKYLSIGNEVNLLHDKYPDRFKNFILAYKAIYGELKPRFPQVKFFTTFQFERLRGNAKLTGNKNKQSQYFIVQQLKKQLDLIGITTYPYFDYKNPKEIPNNYFDVLGDFNKKIAVTETGWMARTRYGGNLITISNKEYTGSEDEQVEYLEKLFSMVNVVDTEFVNWVFMNDISDWRDGDEGTKGLELFDSIGLHYHDGTHKKIWQSWLELKEFDLVEAKSKKR